MGCGIWAFQNCRGKNSEAALPQSQQNSYSYNVFCGIPLYTLRYLQITRCVSFDKILLFAGATVDAADNVGRTALMWAAHSGRLQVTQVKSRM